MRAESFYNLASTYQEVFDDVPDMATLHDRSHGESFLYAVQKHSGPRGLYLLDEPESALSVRGQLALLRHIHDGVAEASQFIIPTHSPILLAYPEAGILQMTNEGPVPIEYQDTDQFQLTQAFLESPDESSAPSSTTTKASPLPQYATSRGPRAELFRTSAPRIAPNLRDLRP